MAEPKYKLIIQDTLIDSGWEKSWADLWSAIDSSAVLPAVGAWSALSTLAQPKIDYLAQLPRLLPGADYTAIATALIEHHGELVGKVVDVLGVNLEQRSVYHEMSAHQLWAEIDAQAEVDRRLSRGDLTPTQILQMDADANKRRRLRPGRKARTDEQYAKHYLDIIGKWRRWERGGHSQQTFAHSMGWGSRTPLTDALRWYRDKFGDDDSV